MRPKAASIKCQAWGLQPFLHLIFGRIDQMLSMGVTAVFFLHGGDGRFFFAFDRIDQMLSMGVTIFREGL